MGANISHRNRFNVHVNDCVREEKRKRVRKIEGKRYRKKKKKHIKRERENALYKANS